MSVKAIEALTALVAEQGRQIVELSKALAIAHEVYATPAIPPPPFMQPAGVGIEPANRLYLTEDEEDALYASGETPKEDTRKALEEILAASGIPAPVTFHS